MLKKEKKPGAAARKGKYQTINRLIDIFVGTLLVIVLSPLFLYICILIYKKEGRPIFQRETYPDENNVSFNLYQFRTLSNPSRLITALPPDPYPGGNPAGKWYRDSRRTMTATGVKLKKYKLDKLPFLFHLIKGDISFINRQTFRAEKHN